MLKLFKINFVSSSLLWLLIGLVLLGGGAWGCSINGADNDSKSANALESESDKGSMSASSDKHATAEGGTMVDERFGPYESAGLTRSGLKSLTVRGAMSRVPRHLFVPKEVESEAYEDRAVKIGSGQTISQPYIVAKMTEEAKVVEGSKVLEVGTGSGYQAAVLAELGAQVFTIEIIPELAAQARDTLNDVGYVNVQTRQGDGWLGWPEEAPFDAIIVTAASPRIPEKLLSQLIDGGRLVFPLEAKSEGGERLLVVEKSGVDIVTQDLGPVRFVPLTGVAREFEQSLDDGDTVLEEILRPFIGGKEENKTKP